MSHKNLVFLRRFGFAVAGIRHALRERSFRTQLGVGVLAGFALVVLRPDPVWWALVGVMVSLVLAAELFNTALEALCDHLHPEPHPAIKVVKDVSAGAVLVLSLGALWVALLMVLSVVYPGWGSFAP